MPSLTRWFLLPVSTRVLVEGYSMWPALREGDRILVDRFAYHRGAPRRGDIVLMRDPGRPGYECIKRIVGLPGEQIRVSSAGIRIVNRLEEPSRAPRSPAVDAGLEWHLGPGQYLVLGDNHAFSTDSRTWGPITRHAILGRAWYRYARRVDGRG